MPYLLVKENGDKKSMQITLPCGIGKKSDNTVVLEESTASRYHCRLFESDGNIFLEDLQSKNGTLINGRAVTANCKVKPGDVIQIGKALIKFSDVKIEDDSVRMPAENERTNDPIVSKAPAPEKKQTLVFTKEQEEYLMLKRRLHEKLLDKLDLKKLGLEVSDDDLRSKTQEALNTILKEEKKLPASIPTKQIIKEITDESVGLGPLEDLLQDETITEIMVNNFDRIYIERKGKLEISEKFFSSNQQVVQAIRRIIAPLGRRIDETSPMVDARLKDGSRVNAIIQPLSISGPSLTIRKFSKKPFTMDNLVQMGSLIKNAADFLGLAVKERKNILISGGTGSGKTTLLNVIASFIPNDERIVTIEDAAELQLPQDHIVTLEAKPPNLDGNGAIPIRKLLINSLRMRPDRIVVGECRGGEALDMLQAMNTGHDGSMTTLHANTPRDALSRLETLVLMSGMELPMNAIRQQIASAVEIIVQTQRLKDGTRKITSIAELVGMQGDIITLQEIYKFDQEGYDDKGMIIGKMITTGNVPSFVFDLKERGIPVDMKLFEKTETKKKDK